VARVKTYPPEPEIKKQGARNKTECLKKDG
jgi:hypothetical protein